MDSAKRDRRLAEFRSARPAVLPSLLWCDFGHLAEDIARLQEAGARGMHLDVMDGHFVPNLTYGPPICKVMRDCTNLPLDAHLMISNPADYLEAYADAGVDTMVIHIEAVPEPRALLDRIRDLGCLAGLAINPPTPLSAIEPYLSHCDSVLVMSVMPGFGGQAFEPEALTKLKALRQREGDRLLLGVDGGVNHATIESCAAAGADLFVCGKAVLGQPDYAAAISDLTALANKGRTAARS